MSDKERWAEPLLAGDAKTLLRLTEEALAAGVAAEDIVRGGLVPAMAEVGERFRNGEVYIPEVMLAARAMQGAMVRLKPLLSRSAGIVAGKVVIGTVKGDLHDIGKNLVVMMMEGGGFDVVDLGADVSVDRFVEAVRTHKPDFVGMSALLTTTMPEMKKAVQALGEAKLREGVRVIVGGAPVTERFAREIGADGFAPDGTSVVAMMKSLL